MQIDNDKCRREARLSGSRLDLNFCMPRGNSRSSRNVDSHGNTLTPISPQSNNNSSPIEDENQKLTTSLTAPGKYCCFIFFIQFVHNEAPGRIANFYAIQYSQIKIVTRVTFSKIY